MRRITAAFSLGAILLSAQLVLADGMFMPPQMSARVAGDAGVASTAQKGLIIDLLDGREVLLLETTYQGPADEFAWVIPVPGRPGREDIFPAATDLLDVAFTQSAPRVETTIHDPLEEHDWGRGGGLLESGPPPPAPGLMPPPPSVTVHERFEMGQYDVAVLSATGTRVLVDWLQDSGYQVPENTQDTLGIYVDKSWYFVALRILPAEATKAPIIEEVEPIGIRFATDQLVYPLAISRASSRQKTEILLVVLADTVVACEQLPEVGLPLEVEHPQGSSYATIRRQALEAPGPGCVVEYRGGRAVPYEDLHYVQDARWPRQHLNELKATRLWTLLDRGDMQDLTFSADPDAARYQLLVHRQGILHYPTIILIFYNPGARIALLAVLCIISLLISYWLLRRGFSMTPMKITGLLIFSTVALALSLFENPICGLGAFLIVAFLVARLRSGAIEPQEGKGITELLPVSQFLRWVTILVGFVLIGTLGFAAILWDNMSFFWSYDNVFSWFRLDRWTAERSALVVALVEVAWCALAIPTVLTYLSGISRSLKLRFGVIATLILILVLVLSTHYTQATVVLGWLVLVPTLLGVVSADLAVAVFSVLAAIATLAAFGLLGSFLVLGAYMSPKAKAAAQLVVVTLLLLTAVAVVIQLPRYVRSAAHAGMIGAHSPAHETLYHPLTQIDGALERFLKDTGCFPAELGDLMASRAPAYGVDSSGNRVKLTGRYLGPYLRQLPEDPLTGRRDTWVYEPTGTPMVASGGYTIVIERAKPLYKEIREGYWRSMTGEWRDPPDEDPLVYYH